MSPLLLSGALLALIVLSLAQSPAPAPPPPHMCTPFGYGKCTACKDCSACGHCKIRGGVCTTCQ